VAGPSRVADAGASWRGKSSSDVVRHARHAVHVCHSRRAVSEPLGRRSASSSVPSVNFLWSLLFTCVPSSLRQKTSFTTATCTSSTTAPSSYEAESCRRVLGGARMCAATERTIAQARLCSPPTPPSPAATACCDCSACRCGTLRLVPVGWHRCSRRVLRLVPRHRWCCSPSICGSGTRCAR